MRISLPLFIAFIVSIAVFVFGGCVTMKEAKRLQSDAYKNGENSMKSQMENEIKIMKSNSEKGCENKLRRMRDGFLKEIENIGPCK